MTLIERKLIDAYIVLVMAEKYVLNESDKINDSQLIVPTKFISDVEIGVAEKTIEKLTK